MEVRRLLRLVDLVAAYDGSSGETVLHVLDLGPSRVGTVIGDQTHRGDGAGVYQRGQCLRLCSSSPITELNGRPVGLTPTFWPTASDPIKA